MKGCTSENSPRCAAVTVRSGSASVYARVALVRVRDDERFGCADDVAFDAASDAPARCLREWPLAIEDARAGERPVDDIGRGTPRLAPTCTMRCAWPDDRPAVAASDEEEALARGGRPVIGRDEQLVLERVAESRERAEPFAKGFAHALGIGTAVGTERPPRLKLFDVFEDDDPGLDGLRPADDDPGEAADLPRDGAVPFAFENGGSPAKTRRDRRAGYRRRRAGRPRECFRRSAWSRGGWPGASRLPRAND